MKTTIDVPQADWMAFGKAVIDKTKSTNKNAVVNQLIKGYTAGTIKLPAK